MQCATSEFMVDYELPQLSALFSHRSGLTDLRFSDLGSTDLGLTDVGFSFRSTRLLGTSRGRK